ncbi:MAG: hypothetical protein DMD79_18845 [Candidatus Rokuibacteriota bacterium]|nr:MAG: hypothetical protein DMD79_18845 [Candidatus Rokubacteria bacterium]
MDRWPGFGRSPRLVGRPVERRDAVTEGPMLWIESGRGRPTIALVVAFALAACAGGAPAPTPAEFPLHATEQQFTFPGVSP